jgi:hypothetical protein
MHCWKLECIIIMVAGAVTVVGAPDGVAVDALFLPSLGSPYPSCSPLPPLPLAPLCPSSPSVESVPLSSVPLCPCALPLCSTPVPLCPCAPLLYPCAPVPVCSTPVPLCPSSPSSVCPHPLFFCVPSPSQGFCPSALLYGSYPSAPQSLSAPLCLVFPREMSNEEGHDPRHSSCQCVPPSALAVAWAPAGGGGASVLGSA